MNYIPGVSGGVPKRGTPLRVDSLENKFVELIHSSKGGSRHKYSHTMEITLSSYRHFIHYFTLHRGVIATWATPLDPRLVHLVQKKKVQLKFSKTEKVMTILLILQTKKIGYKMCHFFLDEDLTSPLLNKQTYIFIFP